MQFPSNSKNKGASAVKLLRLLTLRRKFLRFPVQGGVKIVLVGKLFVGKLGPGLLVFFFL
jgi:hypothetical protein